LEVNDVGGWVDLAPLAAMVHEGIVSHLTPHTSHLTPHTSHLTPHTSHLSGSHCLASSSSVSFVDVITNEVFDTSRAHSSVHFRL
jgi:hypothetical protein